MKKYFVILAIFLAVSVSCSDKNIYPDDTTTFTTKEMTVNVTPTTTSFALVVSQKGGINYQNIEYLLEKSTAVVNKHCYLPKKLYVSFPNKQTTASCNIQIFPEEIKEPLVMTFCLSVSYGRYPNQFIDTVTVKLIPTKK